MNVRDIHFTALFRKYIANSRFILNTGQGIPFNHKRECLLCVCECELCVLFLSLAMHNVLIASLHHRTGCCSMGVDLRALCTRNGDPSRRVDMNLHRVNRLIRFKRRYMDKLVVAGKGIGRNQTDDNRGRQDTNA